MILRPASILLAAALLCSTAPLTAQVTARQGSPDPVDEPTRFKSPMVLDLPLTVADPQYWGTGQVRSTSEVALRKYSCEGVSFVDFAVSANKRRDGNVYLTFDFTLATERGVDKLATVRAAVMAGEREIAARISSSIDAEEGKRATGQVIVAVPEKELRSQPTPTLKLIVKVKENP